MSSETNFCQRCGHRLSLKEIEGKQRPYCSSCGYIAFADPKLAAVVLATMDGKLVMVRRGIEPAMGRWAFPSGYVDRGEAVADAAVREVMEETGLDVRLTAFVGLYSSSGNPVVLAVYSAEVVGGSLRPGGDARETALFDPEALPPLPFPDDDQIVADWQSVTGKKNSPR